MPPKSSVFGINSVIVLEVDVLFSVIVLVISTENHNYFNISLFMFKMFLVRKKSLNYVVLFLS